MVDFLPFWMHPRWRLRPGLLSLLGAAGNYSSAANTQLTRLYGASFDAPYTLPGSAAAELAGFFRLTQGVVNRRKILAGGLNPWRR